MIATISIGALAKQTGVSTHTLRVWESRHGLLRPQRSEGGTRLFNESHVRRVVLVRELVGSGHALASLAQLSNDELDALLGNANNIHTLVPGDAKALREKFLSAVTEFDARTASQILARAAILLEPVDFLEHVVVASLIEVGQQWHDGTMRIAHEHFATGVARALIFSLSRTYPTTHGGQPIISATLPTEVHEVGLLAASLCARMHGREVLYLGTQLPSTEIVYAVEQAEAGTVMLSCVAGDEAKTQKELTRLEDELPPHVRIVVGGRMADSLEVRRVERVQSLRALERCFE